MLLPALALSAALTQVTPAFVGGSLGAGTSLRLHVRMAFNPEPEKLAAIVHLPKGTGLNLTGLPKSDLCPGFVLSGACPKASRIGAIGTATLEAMIGGQLTSGKATVRPVLTLAHAPATPFQCKRYAAGSKGRMACIKRATKPGSSCTHPVKAGIAFDHEKNETGVELTDLPVEFPPGGEGTPPAGWADFVMGPAATVMRTDLNYDTIGWKLKTSIVALCRVSLYESLPGYFHMHEIPLPNHSQARYNIEVVGGYAYGVTLFERYLHPGN